MDSSKLAFKLFAKDAPPLAADAFVPVFHSWIQTRALPEHLLIDVADYKHVQSGPGTVLVAHEANLSTDRADNRLGLLYARKQPIAGDFPERLRIVFRSALQAAQLLEQSPALAGKIQFRTDELLFRINDRLAAPNSTATFVALRPALESFFANLYGAAPELTAQLDSEKPFEVAISSSKSPRIADLFAKL